MKTIPWQMLWANLLFYHLFWVLSTTVGSSCNSAAWAFENKDTLLLQAGENWRMSIMRNIIKKWKLHGTLEIKAKSVRQKYQLELLISGHIHKTEQRFTVQCCWYNNEFSWEKYQKKTVSRNLTTTSNCPKRLISLMQQSALVWWNRNNSSATATKYTFQEK